MYVSFLAWFSPRSSLPGAFLTLFGFGLTLLCSTARQFFVPVQDPVAVSAQRDALLYLLKDGVVRPIGYEPVDRALVFVPDYVVEVNNGGVLRPAVDAGKGGFVLEPLLAVHSFVLCGAGFLFFFVSLVPVVCVFALVFFVFVGHYSFFLQ